MPAPAAKWQESLHVGVISDPHISGKYGFELWAESGALGVEDRIFASGLVYSTRDDAEQAGEDASHAAWKWRNM